MHDDVGDGEVIVTSSQGREDAAPISGCNGSTLPSWPAQKNWRKAEVYLSNMPKGLENLIRAFRKFAIVPAKPPRHSRYRLLIQVRPVAS
jgi:hypothetical protein